MNFLRAASAGVAAAALCGVVLVLLGMDWDLADAMRRERFFVLAADAIFCGWMAALIVTIAGMFSSRLASQRVSAAFWTGAALALSSWHLFAILPAALLLMLALLGRLPAFVARLWPAGALLHLGPAAIFFLYPAETHVLPLLKPMPQLPPAAQPGPAVSAERPDVLFIVADTLRADAILDPATPTPHLDALRARGTWADYAIAPCNQTLPSHMVMFTGLDIEQLGMRSNDSRWPKAAKLRSEWRMRTLAERFRDAGWRTAGVACNVLLTTAPAVDESKPDEAEQDYDDGFEIWNGMGRAAFFHTYFAWARAHTLLGRLLPKKAMAFPLDNLLNPKPHHLLRTHWQEGERTAELALEALAQLLAQPQPGLLFVNLFDPHTPYAAPPPFQSSIADPAARPAGYSAQPKGEFEMRVKVIDALERERAGGAREDVDAEAAYLHQLYREEVAYTDAQLGRLLEAVERGGRPTLILFVGDHGEAFAEHRSLEHHWTLYEEEIRVPFILAGPGIPAGRKLQQVPELVDGTRTLLERFGLADAGISGRNVLTTDDAAPRPALSLMTDHATVREGRWKLIARVSYGKDEPKSDFRPGAYALEPLHLYDLQADPAERTDLLASPASPESVAAQDRLVALLRARMAQDQFPVLGHRVISARQNAALEQLGY